MEIRGPGRETLVGSDKASEDVGPGVVLGEGPGLDSISPQESKSQPRPVAKGDAEWKQISGEKNSMGEDKAISAKSG